MPVVHGQYELGFKQSSLISVIALDGIYNCKMLLFLIEPRFWILVHGWETVLLIVNDSAV